MNKKLSRGYKKYIRKEKARIRREFLDIGEQDKLIAELYKGLEINKPELNTNP